MENLLSMPITPVEVMIGKIAPYVIVGFVQAAMIIGVGVLLFGGPIFGSLPLAFLSTLFIATNLAVGYTISTLAQTQLQAMQMSMMFLMPSMAAVRINVSVRGHADMGALDRRKHALDAQSSDCTRDHAQRLDACGA